MLIFIHFIHSIWFYNRHTGIIVVRQRKSMHFRFEYSAKMYLFVELTMLIDCISLDCVAAFFSESILSKCENQQERYCNTLRSIVWLMNLNRMRKKFQWNTASTLVNAKFPYWFISVRRSNIENAHRIDTDSHYMVVGINQWHRKILCANGWEKMPFAHVKQIFDDFHWIEWMQNLKNAFPFHPSGVILHRSVCCRCWRVVYLINTFVGLNSMFASELCNQKQKRNSYLLLNNKELLLLKGLSDCDEFRIAHTENSISL